MGRASPGRGGRRLNSGGTTKGQLSLPYFFVDSGAGSPGIKPFNLAVRNISRLISQSLRSLPRYSVEILAIALSVWTREALHETRYILLSPLMISQARKSSSFGLGQKSGSGGNPDGSGGGGKLS